MCGHKWYYTCGVVSNGTFPVGSVGKGAARVAFPPPKVGVTLTEPYSSHSTTPLRY